LRQLVVNRTADGLELSNGVSIEVRAASHRRLRGVTCIAVLIDEGAYFYTEEHSSNADVEILTAVRPTLATTNGMLVISSSPYAGRGVLWSLYRKHFGAKGDSAILVAQGPSRTFNSTLSESVVARALQEDRAAGSAEYLAHFRSDVEMFCTLEIVENC